MLCFLSVQMDSCRELKERGSEVAVYVMWDWDFVDSSFAVDFLLLKIFTVQSADVYLILLDIV